MSQAAFAQLSSASAKLVAFQRKKELLDEVERDLDSDLQRLQPAGIVDLQQVVHSGEAAAPPPSSALASWKEQKILRTDSQHGVCKEKDIWYCFGW